LYATKYPCSQNPRTLPYLGRCYKFSGFGFVSAKEGRENEVTFSYHAYINTRNFTFFWGNS
jgi:hypothetical protein